MPNEIYHRSNWGESKAEDFGDVYYDHAATNKLYNHSDYYENSDGTDATLKDLNNKASIVLTPTAYSDGSLNTVIPPYQVLPTELVTNGDFSDGTNNWTAVSAVISASNNILTVDDSANAGGDSRAVQSFTTKVGVTYKVRFNRISTTSSFYLGIGGGVGYNNIFYANLGTDLGIYERTFIATDTTSTIALITSGTGITKFSEVSVKEIQEADFDFSRGSSATRVNEQGLVEDVQILSGELVQNGNFEQIGSELVTNGNFDTDSGWSLPSGSSISDGSLNIDGTQTGGININQTITSLDLTKIYKVTFTVSNYTAGNVKVKISNSAQGTNKTANGTYTEYLSGMVNKLISIKADSDFIGSIDNVSVKEVGQNWTFQNGWNMGDGVAVYSGTVSAYRTIYQEDALTVSSKYRLTFDIVSISSGSIENISQSSPTSYSTIGTKTEDFIATSTDLFLKPTTDADLTIDNVSIKEVTDDTDLPRIDFTDGTGSLLLEPQRTNLVTYSEDFSGYRVAGSTVTPNSTTAPDGTNSGILVTQGVSTLVLRVPNVVAPSTIYTFSGYFKSSGSVTQVKLDITDENITTFDLTNEWQRFSVTAQSKAGGSPYHFVDVDTNGSQGDTFYAWGLQVEQADYATSYIPTSGSTVTRSADVANNSGNADLFNDSEGVLYAEVSALSNTPDNSKYISISDGTYNNRASILFSNGATNQIRTFLRVGGVAQIDVSDNVTDVTDFNKVAFSYKENDFKVYINGSLVSTDTSGSVWTSGTINKLSFSEISTSAGLFNGNVKCVAVFKEALSNDLLERLTGEGYESFRLLAEANNYTII